MDKINKDQLADSLLLAPFRDAVGLIQRYQEVQGFRGYVRDRMLLVIPIVVLMLLVSIACAASLVLYLGGTRSILVLLMLLLIPFVLLGSFFVQAYVFGSWLEGRSLAKALHHHDPVGPIAARLQKLGIVDMGKPPKVPWALAVVFVFIPLLMLLAVAPAWGWALLLLMIAAPIAFARLDPP